MINSLLIRQMARDGRHFVHATPVLMFGIVMATLTFFAGVVKADLLHDTLWMTDNNSYTMGAQNFIGGFAQFDEMRDDQVGDDFNLTDTYNINTITADFVTISSPMVPAHGVLVEFFSDLGGTPSNSPAAQVLSTNVSTDSFANHLSQFHEQGLRITVDLSTEEIALGPGNWWVAVTPVDETQEGIGYYSARQAGFVEGAPAHVRQGGAAHGNDYAGGWPGGGDWVPFPFFLGEGDIALRIEGTLVPGPGALALLSIAGLFGRTRRPRH